MGLFVDWKYLVDWKYHFLFFAEAKRQEFEQKRKEMDENRKMNKRKTNPDGTPKKNRKKKKEATEMEKMVFALQGPGPGQGHPMGMYDPHAHGMMDKEQPFDGLGLPLPQGMMSPEKEKKKRIRKTKKEKQASAEAAVVPPGVPGPGPPPPPPGENLDSIFEQFNLQLKQLPSVPLMEPHVGHTYAICSVAGSAPVISGEFLVIDGVLVTLFHC